MAWGTGLTNLATNIGISIDAWLVIIAVLGSLIFSAKDFKLGMIMLFLSSGCCFMLSFYKGGNWTYAVVVFFMSLVVMAITLYPIAEASERGGLV